jgi:NDP-sugar pyrophosphorylase family protein
MIKFHIDVAKKNKTVCTLAVSSLNAVEFGATLYDKQTGNVISFKEKPKISEISDFVTNCGIAVCSPKVVDYCDRKADFFKNTVPKILKDREVISCYDIAETFCDIGSFSALDKITEMLRKKRNHRQKI